MWAVSTSEGVSDNLVSVITGRYWYSTGAVWFTTVSFWQWFQIIWTCFINISPWIVYSRNKDYFSGNRAGESGWGEENDKELHNDRGQGLLPLCERSQAVYLEDSATFWMKPRMTACQNLTQRPHRGMTINLLFCVFVLSSPSLQ